MAPPQWAYQVENFVTEPDEELVCSICRSVFCDPALCPCDHVFCKICITKWLQNNRNCPICRKRMYNTSIKQSVPIIKNLIMKLILNCHNKSLGCKAQFSVESSEAHVKECEYEFVQCKNVPCTDKLFRKDITEHETKDCPYRYIKCKKCKCKMSSTTAIETHNCIAALRELVKEKKEMIQKQNDRIKELEAEIEGLKTTLQDTGHSRMPGLSRGHSLTSGTLSSISPDEITINIHEYDSQSSLSSDSDISSDSFYIFANDPLPDDDNEESDSFSTYMDNEENVENENTRNASEYRNAESQTVDIDRNAETQTVDADPLSLSLQRDEIRNVRSGNSAYENDSTIVEVPNSVFGEAEEHSQSRRTAKRRPTFDKPAKRRLRPLSSDSDDDKEDKNEHTRLSLQPPKQGSHLNAAENKLTEINRGDTLNSGLEAGPSSSSAPHSSSRRVSLENPKSKKFSRIKSKQKRAKQAGNYAKDNAVSSRVAVTPGFPVFERTLALLEQYNLESDPEWLPEYASHTGNTTTESDSSSVVESSENSDVDSLENKSVTLDGSQHELPAISDFMNWMFDTSSEDDPDWRPPNYDSYEDDQED